MSPKIPIIAIVGRTNVGKSTLFNQICGRPMQIVRDTHGVTRDRAYAFVKRFSFPFNIIDTGGMIGEENEVFADIIRQQAELAINEADIIFAVFDGVEGVHPYDEQVVDYLRRAKKPVIHVINKCEKPSTEMDAGQFYSLGIKDAHFISAAHNSGIKELMKKAQDILKVKDFSIDDYTEDDKIRVSIIGRPNVGKSSILNRLTGDQRVVISDEAGTTRDSVNIVITRDGQEYEIVDTAGLRRKKKVDDTSIEEESNWQTLRALSESDVCLLVIDATQGVPSEQDAKIAGLIHERGRGLIVVVNKWDAIEKDHKSVKKFETEIKEVLKFVPYAPILFVSALTGRRCPSILEKAKEVHTNASLRIKTAELNSIMESAFATKPPPVYRGEPVKLYFSVQTSIRPPSFVLFVNHPREINFSYERYIKNSLRKKYPFTGVDLRIMFRKKTNNADKKND